MEKEFFDVYPLKYTGEIPKKSYEEYRFPIIANTSTTQENHEMVLENGDTIKMTLLNYGSSDIIEFTTTEPIYISFVRGGYNLPEHRDSIIIPLGSGWHRILSFLLAGTFILFSGNPQIRYFKLLKSIRSKKLFKISVFTELSGKNYRYGDGKIVETFPTNYISMCPVKIPSKIRLGEDRSYSSRASCPTCRQRLPATRKPKWTVETYPTHFRERLSKLCDPEEKFLLPVY